MGNFNPFIIFVKYLTGFGNEFASEALPDALPVGQVSLKYLRLLHKIEAILIDFGI